MYTSVFFLEDIRYIIVVRPVKVIVIIINDDHSGYHFC
jgi:hypothetical protein